MAFTGMSHWIVVLSSSYRLCMVSMSCALGLSLILLILPAPGLLQAFLGLLPLCSAVPENHFFFLSSSPVAKSNTGSQSLFFWWIFSWGPHNSPPLLWFGPVSPSHPTHYNVHYPCLHLPKFCSLIPMDFISWKPHFIPLMKATHTLNFHLGSTRISGYRNLN